MIFTNSQPNFFIVSIVLVFFFFLLRGVRYWLNIRHSEVILDDEFSQIKEYDDWGYSKTPYGRLSDGIKFFDTTFILFSFLFFIIGSTIAFNEGGEKLGDKTKTQTEKPKDIRKDEDKPKPIQRPPRKSGK